MITQEMLLKESLNFLLMLFSILHGDFRQHYALGNAADCVL